MAFGVVNPARMKTSSATLIGALGAFLFCTSMFLFLARGQLAAYFQPPVEKTAEVAVPVPVTSVIVANRDIEIGTPLSPGLFHVETRPAGEVPPSSITSVEDVQGAYSNTFLSAKLPVLKGHLTTTKSINLLTERIPKGFRAVTILVDTRSAVEGWALPGARVDVVWTTTVKDKRTLKVIVENAKVLSAERVAETVMKPQGGAALNLAVPPSTVTLLVSSQDSQKIQYASTSGVLSLSLRGDDDIAGSGGPNTVDMSDMLGGQKTEGEASQGKVRIKTPDGKWETYNMVNGQLQPQ